ncbi:hypothetical protein SLE2022_190350 [Rubroshorea leprosula]
MLFQFNPISVKLTDLNTEMLKVRAGEALALISVLTLNELLAEDDRVDAHFSTGKDTQNSIVKYCRKMDQFLSTIRSASPKVFFLVEQEADHNQTRLVDRFVEGLHYYSAVFDSIDATLGGLAGGGGEGGLGGDVWEGDGEYSGMRRGGEGGEA